MTDNKKPRGRPSKKEPTTRVEFRADLSDKESWEDKAKSEDKTLSAWIKAVLNREAK